jgi:hypothetical protein
MGKNQEVSLQKLAISYPIKIQICPQIKPSIINSLVVKGASRMWRIYKSLVNFFFSFVSTNLNFENIKSDQLPTVITLL